MSEVALANQVSRQDIVSLPSGCNIYIYILLPPTSGPGCTLMMASASDLTMMPTKQYRTVL
ncbi:MAG: hypothetical protein ACKPKO_64615 [Candidatus Fonsibacter sp.]